MIDLTLRTEDVITPVFREMQKRAGARLGVEPGKIESFLIEKDGRFIPEFRIHSKGPVREMSDEQIQDVLREEWGRLRMAARVLAARSRECWHEFRAKAQ